MAEKTTRKQSRHRGRKGTVKEPSRPSKHGARRRLRIWGYVVAIPIVGAGLLAGYYADPLGWFAAHPSNAGVPETLPVYDPYFSQFVEQVRQAPNQPEGYATLGQVYEANQFFADARVCYQWVLDLAPDGLLTRYHLGIVLQKLGDAQGAEIQYRTLLDGHPDFAPAVHRLGDLLAESGRDGEAEAAFQRVMKLAPDAAAGFASAAAMKLRKHDYADAAELARKAETIQPGARLPHFQLSRAYEGLNRPDDAARERKLGRGAAKLFLPDDWTETFPRHTVGVPVHVRIDRAKNYLAQGDPQRAIQLLRFALEWYADDPDVLAELAAAYLRLNEPEKACVTLDRAVPRTGEDPRLQAYLAMCKALLGNLNEAKAAADRAVSLAPSSPLSHLARGRVKMRQGGFPDALDDLRKAVELDGSDATLQLELGNDYMLMNQFGESRRHYQAAVDLDPENVEARLRLSAMCSRLGDLAEARVQLNAARQLAPNHPQVQALATQLDSMNR